MIHFAVALGLLLHVLLWGAGAAMLAMPRPWQRFWPMLVVPAGFALQSLAVWLGAHANLRGTDSYAWFALVVPVALLVIALGCRGAGSVGADLSATASAAGRRVANEFAPTAGLRAAWSDLKRFGALWTAMGACLALLVLPLSLTSPGLTTISLGSCDAADYAAGARVLMEFARTDREGFIGLTEVVRVHSVDNFFDYWLRLNHFTPAALIALNGSVLNCAPHELASLVTMLVLAGSLPVVWWTARAVFRLPRTAGMWIALLYGLSPVTWYAVAHVSPGQLLVAPAIALLTWSGMAMWRRLAPGGWRRGAGFAGVLAISYAIILGSYNFIVLVCLVPAVAYAGGLGGWHRKWTRLLRWSVLMVAPLVACGVVLAARVLGLAERFTLLRTYDFGWRIPPLSPEGWLGFLGEASTLAPLSAPLRWGLSLLALALVIAAARRRPPLAWRIVCGAGPGLAGYAFLQWRGATLGTNASYDAYKLLAVFFPGVLAASLAWLRWTGGAVRLRVLSGVTLALVGLAHAISLSELFHALKAAPLRVPLEFRELRKIETMPDVASVNLLVPDMWSRLWANALLLRTPQYFLTHTYEARLDTPLRGEWDLLGGRVTVVPAPGARRQVSRRFAIVDTRAPTFLRATPADGWHHEEIDPPSGERWQWTQREATIAVENPQRTPLTITCAIDGHGVGARHVSLSLAESGVVMAAVALGEARGTTPFPPLTIPPGKSTLVLRSAEPATVAGASDPRLLAVCVFRFEIAVTK